MKPSSYALLLFSLMTTFTFAQNDYSLRIGHRGAKGHIAENTVESVIKAADLHCKIIEIDVHIAKTGEVVVFHDDTLDRVTNGTGRISETSFEDLRVLKVDHQYTIPTLEEVIVGLDKKAVLNIELKGEGTAEKSQAIVESFLAKGWNKQDFIYSSFLWNELETIYNLDPAMATAVLTSENPEEAIPFALKIKAKAINPHHKKLNNENAKAIKKANLKIYPWTVNDPKDIQRMKELKVDGIITDFPDRV